jgi:hypothetical protein
VLAVRSPLVAVKPPWNKGWRSDRPLVVVRPLGLTSAARNNIVNEIFSKEFQ